MNLSATASFVSNSELRHAGHKVTTGGEANRDMALTCPGGLSLFVRESLHCVGGYTHEQRDLLKSLALLYGIAPDGTCPEDGRISWPALALSLTDRSTERRGIEDCRWSMSGEMPHREQTNVRSVKVGKHGPTTYGLLV